MKTPIPTLFALLIGIDNYRDKEVNNLQGAVSDVKLVEQFLTSDLQVPSNRVMKLCNEQATRETIISAIEYLANNSDIKEEDPILIFFAGHGSEAEAPSKWDINNKKKIQMLLPHDFCWSKPKESSSNDLVGHGIWDVTMNRLLTDIANKKSDNITVVLDCCHSGSGTRSNNMAIRGVALPHNYIIPLELLPPPLPEPQSDKRSPGISKGYEKNGHRSHVLLAACRSDELAREFLDEGNLRNGHFTKALINYLKPEGRENLSCRELMANLSEIGEHQHPQCEGAYQDRILFSSHFASPRHSVFVIHEIGSNQYVLKAGEANGVGNSTQFEVFSDSCMTQRLGTVVASEPTEFETRCSAKSIFEFPPSGIAYARQICFKTQDLHIFIGDDVSPSLRRRLDDERVDKSRRSFRLVNSKNEPHDLAISSASNRVEFHSTDKTCISNNLTRMCIHSDVSDISGILSILHSAADFYFHLRHCSTNQHLTKGIIFEFRELRLVKALGQMDGFSDVLAPDGDNLYGGSEGCQIIVDAYDTKDNNTEKHTRYGYKITNNHSFPLYAALFSFNVGDLSIQDYYYPKKADEFIPANGFLTIGFGDSDTDPQSYYLEKNQDIDISFLKLYLSTQYVDFSDIPQPSPSDSRKPRNNPLPPPSLWDTLTIPLIQKRKAVSGSTT
ncbi:hypothetical protein VKT23_000266 [Stygiomarasmius scandens]|uniref:Peptidase C14 caspase domain-containing protein n=1 Tax=Marasmiellus scandens TaxID=2682957 RepID=A0ABR1K696_9AGAR